MAIAVQKGLVQGANDSIALYLPGLPKDGKEKRTIKDLLNMRSGLDTNDKDPSPSGEGGYSRQVVRLDSHDLHGTHERGALIEI